MNADSPAAPSPSSPGQTSRRRALALLGAGGAAGLATLLSRDEAQAGHDGTNVLHLGQQNNDPGVITTSLNANRASPALGVNNPSGPALACSTEAVSPGGTPAVRASGAQIGVEGVSVGAAAGDPLGFRRIGIAGRSETGVGVSGTSESGTGVRAQSARGPALAVDGRLEFNSAGQGRIPQGANSGFVGDCRITPFSHISVTLTGNPGPRALSWVERRPGVGFVVHLTPAPRSQRPDTPLTYVFSEPRPTGGSACFSPS